MGTVTLLARAEEAERASQADEFRIISEAALAVFGWQSALYKRVLRLLEADAPLDAAMTLVPEGWFGRVEPRFYSDDGEVRWRGYALRPDWSKWTPHDDWVDSVGPASAATPPLALCAAALRARAASQ